MPSLYSHLRQGVSLAVCLFLIAGNVTADETDPDGRLFKASADPVSDVQQTLARADEGDRRALVVLGANWCHDSRALAARLQQSPLQEVIQQDYELVFVDVGFLDKGTDVLDELGVAQFYATPTLLIVDPASGQVINDEDRHIWGDAYSIDMASSVEYFEKWASNDPGADPSMDSAELRKLYAQIDQFERQQAERVAAGYAVVGPLLKAYKAGGGPEKFRPSWDELRDFRMAIPGDIRALRDEAQRRVAEGETDIQLEFPEHRLHSWEIK